MRKTVCLFVCVILLFLSVPTALADQSVSAFCVISPQSSDSISEYSADELLGVAGLSKLPAILTLCNAVDRGILSLDTTVTIGMKASEIGGPTAFLKVMEQIRAEELLRAAVMISAGDAIWALMDNAFGSEDVFLQNITLMLKEIGIDHEMKHALGTSERFTCRELTRLGAAALQSETFMKYCAVKYAVLKHPDGRETELANANKLLSSLSGCTGLLTGSSAADGYCGVFACRRGSTTFVCALIGAKNSKTRFEAASQYFEEAFANYSICELASEGEPIVLSYPVEGGDTDTVDLFTDQSLSLMLKKSDGQPQMQFQLPDALSAPLDPEFAVGTVSFLDRNGSVLYELAIYPGQKVTATGFREILKRIIGVYVSG